MTAGQKSPTLKQVAERAGVSPMTVSRVLAGGHHVSAEVSERVLAAVSELGYRRNDVASRLRSQRGSGLVGVAITNIDNPYYAQVVLGVEDAIRASGRRILLGTTAEDPEREATVVADFVGRQVEGIVLVPSGARAHLRPAALAGRPLVLASRAVPGVRADTVLVDDVNGSHEATLALFEQGYRRLAFLGNAESVSTSSRRLEGFLLAHEDAGVPVDQTLVRRGAHSVEQACETALDLLALPQPPDAFFAANNRNAVGLLTALARHRTDDLVNGAVPGLAVFDQFDLAEFVPWPIAVVEHDAREVGRIAGRMLLDRLERGEDARDHEPPEVPLRTVQMPAQVVWAGTPRLPGKV
ncbi:LacI family DNA-binding transcriptional regulator [Aestuariimicrobium kwangyangense]|uniref:LacI family DNA-binding transcriptional regulator n=1 Tax=Aestuariimicrobium kwangyangense TaxID=396389 RepID=UPI0003B315BF|nr:LacI family DNA-binding transcriptional regulator [Aestuariimicrobium kwangyangense]